MNLPDTTASARHRTRRHRSHVTSAEESSGRSRGRAVAEKRAGSTPHAAPFERPRRRQNCCDCEWRRRATRGKERLVSQLPVAQSIAARPCEEAHSSVQCVSKDHAVSCRARVMVRSWRGLAWYREEVNQLRLSHPLVAVANGGRRLWSLVVTLGNDSRWLSATIVCGSR